jgi:L-arabinose isomerase
MVNQVSQFLPPKVRRKTRIGLVAGGLGTYWPQFPGLLPQLQESARYVSNRFETMDARSPRRSCASRTATSS